MRKIPTLFKRVFTTDHKKTITREVTPGCECVLRGECTATVKWDGACCAIINGEIYKRYDAKIGKYGKRKMPPEGAIPCQPEPDPITGHWPHWVKCEEGNPADKYFLEAYEKFKHPIPEEKFYDLFGFDDTIWTFEAVGPSWQANPYDLEVNQLKRHGADIIPIAVLINPHYVGHKRDSTLFSFDSIKAYLNGTPIEGIVFWKDGQPLCKIKRSDFGFPWPQKNV